MICFNSDKIINQPVILSEVELLRVERSEQAKARGFLAEVGSRNNSWWLVDGMLHLLQKATQTRLEIPAALWRLGFSSLLAQKNFDYAQDDIRGCLKILGKRLQQEGKLYELHQTD